MTLNEAIVHAEEVAKEQDKLCKSMHPAEQLSDYEKCAEDHRQLAEWLKDYKRLIEREPCEDAISRQAVLDAISDTWKHICSVARRKHPTKGEEAVYNDMRNTVRQISPVKPQAKTGHWLRMSDLSEQDDDRYKCACCGNVVHYTNEMNLYTFNSWCGRCGSDNGRHINYEVEE